MHCTLYTQNTKQIFIIIRERKRLSHRYIHNFTIFRSISECHSISKIHLINFERNAYSVCCVHNALNEEIMAVAANVTVLPMLLLKSEQEKKKKFQPRNGKIKIIVKIAILFETWPNIHCSFFFFFFFCVSLSLCRCFCFHRDSSLNFCTILCWNSRDIVLNQFLEIL